MYITLLRHFRDRETTGADMMPRFTKGLAQNKVLSSGYRANQINIKMLPSAARIFGGDTPPSFTTP